MSTNGPICSVEWQGTLYHIGQWADKDPEVYTDDDVCALLTLPPERHSFWRKHPGLRERCLEQYNAFTLKALT